MGTILVKRGSNVGSGALKDKVKSKEEHLVKLCKLSSIEALSSALKSPTLTLLTSMLDKVSGVTFVTPYKSCTNKTLTLSKQSVSFLHKLMEERIERASCLREAIATPCPES